MKRVLVVDDEVLVADTLSVILRNEGFEARAAYSVEEALGCAIQFNPDLLLCDITMPQRDGIALMEAINRMLPGCRVLALTGYYSNVQRVLEESEMWEHPAAVLTKPCAPKNLLRRAGAMLAN